MREDAGALGWFVEQSFHHGFAGGRELAGVDRGAGVRAWFVLEFAIRVMRRAEWRIGICESLCASWRKKES
jgi:hypothetical protein